MFVGYGIVEDVGSYCPNYSCEEQNGAGSLQSADKLFRGYGLETGVGFWYRETLERKKVIDSRIGYWKIPFDPSSVFKCYMVEKSKRNQPYFVFHLSYD